MAAIRMALRAEPSASDGSTISAGGGLREIRSSAARTLEMELSAPSRRPRTSSSETIRLPSLSSMAATSASASLTRSARCDQRGILLGAIAFHFLDGLFQGLGLFPAERDRGFDCVESRLAGGLILEQRRSGGGRRCCGWCRGGRDAVGLRAGYRRCCGLGEQSRRRRDGQGQRHAGRNPYRPRAGQTRHTAAKLPESAPRP